MSHGQAPETSRAGSAAFYFASDRPCVGPAEVCFSSAYPREGPAEVYFVAKLTGEGLADCHFVPDLPRAGLTGYVWRLSELPEDILLMDIISRNFPKKYYS